MKYHLTFFLRFPILEKCSDAAAEVWSWKPHDNDFIWNKTQYIIYVLIFLIFSFIVKIIRFLWFFSVGSGRYSLNGFLICWTLSSLKGLSINKQSAIWDFVECKKIAYLMELLFKMHFILMPLLCAIFLRNSLTLWQTVILIVSNKKRKHTQRQNND